MPEAYSADKPDASDPVADFMATARARFEQDVSDEEQLRREAEIDARFEAGQQWDATLEADRKKAGRPVLTFNRMHTFIQQVANEARQNKAQIKFIPSEEGDKDTADIYEGLARHIQYSSDAQVAYETAVECAAGSSFGYFRYLTDYCDDESADQELKVVPVFDPFCIYGVLIPACLGQEPKHAFVIEYLTPDEYKQQYPDSKLASFEWAEAQKEFGEWVGERVRIAEYWTVEETLKTISLGGYKKRSQRTRNVVKRKVKVCKINACEVLEGSETEWPGPTIPIIPVLGKLKFVDGSPQLLSVIRHQRGSQKLINLYKTRIAETLMTQPIQPYLVPKGAVSPQDKPLWENMNTQPRPYLEYEVKDHMGREIAPPTRQIFEPPIVALSAATDQEIDGMKAEAGIFDASLGHRSNEASGIALQRRQQQSSLTNLHFMDNLERAFQKAGKNVLAPVIPKVYDTPRMIRILGADEAPKVVRINQPFEENGRVKQYKIGGKGVGKYDVVVTMGRSFSTKRMESFDMMVQVLQGNPDLLPMIGDIFFRNSDLAGAEQLAERFKKMLPANLQDGDENDPAQMAAMLQAKLTQKDQETQQLNAYAQQVEKEREELQRKLDAKVVENTTRLEIEKLKIQAEVTIAEIGAKAQDARERAKWEGEMVRDLNVQASEAERQQQEQLHEAALAAEQRQHEGDMADRAFVQQQVTEAQEPPA